MAAASVRLFLLLATAAAALCHAAAAETCVIPEQPPNGQYVLGGCDSAACLPKPGSLVEAALLNYTCGSGFRLSGSPVVICDQQWFSAFPTCVKDGEMSTNAPPADSTGKCTPLYNPSRTIKCNFGNKEVNCSLPMEPLTKATLRCKTFYQAPSHIQVYEITCLSDGLWSKPILPCTPECGEFSNEGYIPWYAAVFRKKQNNWSLECPASIVSPRVLLSAAHCFWDGDKLRVVEQGDHIVVVGQYEYAIGDRQSNIIDPLIVERVLVPEKFRGYRRRYADDISVILLKNEIVMNEFIHPVCLDFDEKYTSHLLPGKIGILGSWEDTVNGIRKQKVVSIPVVDYKQCLETAPAWFTDFLTYDKLCAGYLESKSVCSQDQGVGFANNFSDGRWYLTGIASAILTASTTCDTSLYKTFTKLSTHLEFIKKSLIAIGRQGDMMIAARPIANVLCRENEFQCMSKECVNNITLCDGKRHCADGSDETPDTCRQRRCAQTLFRCKYGACIDRKFLCNGENECADGSDEESTVCAEGITSSSPGWGSPSKLCTLPKQPLNGRYTVVGSTTDNNPGTVVSVGVVLNYSCNTGFVLSGSSLLACQNGWSSEFPFCSTVSCKPLNNPSRQIRCILNGEEIDCESKSVAPGTRASVKCRIYYESVPGLQAYDMICESSGKWSRDLQFCIPKCGVSNPGGVPFISGGGPSLLAELPWHIGLYLEQEKGILPSCGGSLISTRIAISAAHCFWANDEVSFDRYKIVAGKYYYAWENKTKYVQHLQIQDVVVPAIYKDRERNYADDIAVIILKYGIQINDAVRPICIDYEQKYTPYIVPERTTGIVAGWGLNENQSYSEVLNVANLGYADAKECEKHTPRPFHSILTSDKFCGGHENRTTVCPGDSGGGYAVKFGDGRFYLVGIVSIGPDTTCGLYPYVAFTKILNHLNFIAEYAYKYA